MKNLITALFLAVAMTACTTDSLTESKKSIEKPIVEASISGEKWVLNSSIVNGKPREFDIIAFTFNQDNKCTIYRKGGTDTNSGTYTLTNGDLSARFDEKTPISLLTVKVTSITEHELRWEREIKEGLLQEVYVK